MCGPPRRTPKRFNVIPRAPCTFLLLHHSLTLLQYGVMSGSVLRMRKCTHNDGGWAEQMRSSLSLACSFSARRWTSSSPNTCTHLYLYIYIVFLCVYICNVGTCRGQVAVAVSIRHAGPALTKSCVLITVCGRVTCVSVE